MKMVEKVRLVAAGTGALFSLPLMILNWSAIIVGGIWLAFYREWTLLIAGVVVVFFGHFLLSLFVTFGVAIGVLAVKARWAVLRYPLLALMFIYNLYLITNWAVAIFAFCIAQTHGSIWPYILWGYAASTIPWTDLARGENNQGTIRWVLGTQFGAAAIMASILVGHGIQSRFGMGLFFVPAALLGMTLTRLTQQLATGQELA